MLMYLLLLDKYPAQLKPGPQNYKNGEERLHRVGKVNVKRSVVAASHLVSVRRVGRKLTDDCRNDIRVEFGRQDRERTGIGRNAETRLLESGRPLCRSRVVGKLHGSPLCVVGRVCRPVLCSYIIAPQGRMSS